MPKGLRKIVCALLVAGVAGGVILAGNRPLAVPVAGVQTPSAPGAPAQDPESNKVVDFVADRGYPIPYGDTTATVLVGHFAAQHNGAVITCDSAIRYNDKRIECFGNVLINKKETYIYGDRADYKFVGEALAASGTVTVVADYRLSPAVRYPVFLQDSAEAVKLALNNAEAWGVSPERVFLMGHSAGAYNAAMLALDPRWLPGAGVRRAQIAGWIGLAGPYDFLPIDIPEVQVAFEWPNTPVNSQPLFYALQPDAAAPQRVLLLAAREDEVVNPQRNTVALAQALKQRGEAVQAELFGRVGHATLIGAMAAPLRGLAPVLETVRQFLANRAS